MLERLSKNVSTQLYKRPEPENALGIQIIIISGWGRATGKK
jgi:hypothetical protein